MEGAENNIPDEDAHRAAMEIYNLLETLNEDDIVLALFSGTKFDLNYSCSCAYVCLLMVTIHVCHLVLVILRDFKNRNVFFQVAVLPYCLHQFRQLLWLRWPKSLVSSHIKEPPFSNSTLCVNTSNSSKVGA